MLTVHDFRIEAQNLLHKQYGLLTAMKVEEIVDTYIEVVTNEVLSNLKTKLLFDNVVKVRLDVITKTKGRRRLEKGSNKKVVMQKWFEENIQLFKIVTKGYYAKNKNKDDAFSYTEIELLYELEFKGLKRADLIKRVLDVNDTIGLNDEYTDIVFNYLYSTHYSTYKASKTNTVLVDKVTIDLNGLKKHIKKITRKYKADKKKNGTVKGDNGKEKILNAIRIYKAGLLNNGELVQIINESDFGRKYYKALSLQATKKETRHIALGNCIEYDFENAVYAWRYNEVKRIQSNTTWVNTEDYLNNKVYWRETLAIDVFGKTRSKKQKEENIKRIKQAFTAMSFGARGSTKTAFYIKHDGVVKHLALNGIIGDKQQVTAFLQHSFIKTFVREQNKISKIIFDDIKGSLTTLAFLHRNGKLVQNKALSYAYQKNERMIMDACIKHIDDKDFLLMVHDAFYVKTMDNKTLIKIKNTLKRFNTHLKLDKTVHKI